MNRRVVIISFVGFSAVAFGGGALLFRTLNEGGPSGPTARESLVRSHSPVLGPEDGPVTVVEFFDPACEACRAFYPVVKRIIAAFPGKVRVVLRYAAFHPPSEEAIRILEAARLQGLFEPVLEALLRSQSRWAPHGRDPKSPWAVVEQTGLAIERAKREAQMPDIVAVLNQDAADVKAAGVRQTPTFFVNGQPLAEFGAQQLYDLVKAEVDAL